MTRTGERASQGRAGQDALALGHTVLSLES